MSDRTDIQLASTSELSDDLVEQIRSLDRRTIWGDPPDGQALTWVSGASWVVLVCINSQVASHVGILEREITVDGEPLRVAGISSVMTEAEFQGRGYATAAIERATEFIRSRIHVPFALLTCLEHRRSFYERLGWTVVPNPVICEQPSGKIQLNTPGRWVMFLPFEGRVLPLGAIDLRGGPW